MKAKNDLIKDIIRATRSKPEDVFDILNEYTETYLEKLLAVIKGL